MEILQMSLNRICRICLRIPKKSINLFINNEGLLEKVNSISLVKIELLDGLPKYICDDCCKNIHHTYNFQKLIKHSDYDLKSRLEAFRYDNYLKEPPKIGTEIFWTETFKEYSNIDITPHDNPVLEETDNFKIKTENDVEIVNDINSIDKPERIYRCTRCPAQFLSNKELTSHRTKIHTPLVVCTICGAKSREDNYKHHMDIHTAPKNCNLCGLVLKNASSLRFHMARKHRETKIICNICGKHYALESEYRRHYLRHTDPDLVKQRSSKPCSVCGKRVKSIRKHMLSHTGEKPHICPYCNKGFQGKYGLKIHIRQHTNERPYVCEHCGDSFAQTVSLRTHLKSKHGIIKKQIDT